MRKRNAVFITGTDTGVGKTLIAAALGRRLRERGLNIGVSKPILTGCAPSDPAGDTSLLIRLTGADTTAEDSTLQWYEAPMSPLAAARCSDAPYVDTEAIEEKLKKLIAKRDIFIIEGIGGALAPLTESYTIADLASQLEIPAVVVARAGLGTLNHTLLTVEALSARQIEVKAIVLNQTAPGEDASFASNPEVLDAILLDIPILGPVPYMENPVDRFDDFVAASEKIFNNLADIITSMPLDKRKEREGEK